MIFNIKKHEIGDIKVVTRFALFPIRIDNDTVVWIKKYKAKYRREGYYFSDKTYWERLYRWIEKDGVKE